jgi:hypothetical protein
MYMYLYMYIFMYTHTRTHARTRTRTPMLWVLMWSPSAVVEAQPRRARPPLRPSGDMAPDAPPHPSGTPAASAPTSATGLGSPLPHLRRELQLGGNRLAELPKSIGALVCLQIATLSANSLTVRPQTHTRARMHTHTHTHMLALTNPTHARAHRYTHPHTPTCAHAPLATIRTLNRDHLYRQRDFERR